jgi:CubicO group peptidase (beta-lactamase class C family)
MFRQDFGYCNSCFLTAGEVIPAVTGKSWEAFVRDSIVRLLGMHQTRVLSDSAASLPNMAQPYTTNYTGTLQRVPFDNWNNLAPAASIISNVSDLAQWLFFQLDSGRHQGKQVMPFSVLQKTRDVQIITGSRKSSIYPVHFRGYGLGLFASDYAGRAVYWHTGGAGGMVSNVCFVPEEKLGIAILSNNDNQSFFELLRYQILDAYLGVPYVNRSQQQLEEWQERVKGKNPALPLSAYTGTYSHPLYGNIQISSQGKTLEIRFLTHPDLSATLLYMDEGQWLMQYNNIEYGIHQVAFNIQSGKVLSITSRQNEYVELEPYTFVKQ